MAAFIQSGAGAIGARNFVQPGWSFVTRVEGRRVAGKEKLNRSVLTGRRRTWVAKKGEHDIVETEAILQQSSSESNLAEGKETVLSKGEDEGDCEGIGIVSSRKTLDGRVLFGEFLSTMLFVLVSMMPVENAGIAPPLPVAAMIGATAAAYMPVSGAHLNPAVTIALALTGRVKPIRAVAYIPVQIIAAIAGVFISRVLGASKELPALPVSLSKSGILSAILLEFMPMFIITCVIFLTAVASEKEGGVGPKLAPIYISFTVFACICAFQPAMFNPARAVAVGLFSGVLKGHWVYWLGSILGAVAAGTMCEHVFLAPASNRAPQSWLAALRSRYVAVNGRVKSLGIAGLISYGILNTLFYCVTFSIMLAQTGMATGTPAALAKAWLLTWSLSQLTKPLRFILSAILAPFVDRLLSAWRRRRTQHDPY